MFNKKLKNEIIDLKIEIKNVLRIIQRVCPHRYFEYYEELIPTDLKTKHYKDCMVCGKQFPLTNKEKE